MTDLKYWLIRNKHISHRLHCDDLPIMNELYLLMKGKMNSPNSVNPRLTQKQVKGCRNPQSLEQYGKNGRTYQQLNLQGAHNLHPSAIIGLDFLSGGTKVRGRIAKGNGSS